MKNFFTTALRMTLALVIALVLNAAFFFAIPVLNALLFDRGEKKTNVVEEVTEVEYNVQEKKQEPQKRTLRTVMQPNTFKTTRANAAGERAKGFKMDLSLARGEAGDGVGVAVGESENIVYEANEVDEEARVLREINPVYPERAKKLGVTGYVKIFLIIDTNGDVSQVDVQSVDPPGYGFETEALKAVRQWKFEPAKLGHFPVSQKATKEFRFAR